MIFLFFLSEALAYEPVKDILFSSLIEKNTIKIKDNTLNYSFYKKEKTVYPTNLANNGIYNSSSASLKKIEEINPNAAPCRPNEYLEIYEISLSELNEEKRFSMDFFNQSGIWGYFDPRRDEKKIDSIMVTQHSLFNNFQILTHEVAHYWYSAYCLERYTIMTSEEFAREIQFSLKEFNIYD